MRKEIRSILILFWLMVIISSPNVTFSQSLRGLVNDGVDQYADGNFSDAEVNFKKGTEKAPANFEAQFNLGDAYFKQQRYDEAIKSYQSSLAMARTDTEKSKVHYNVGNSLLKSQKIEESIEEYKKSLKLNPHDQEAKYNLSYALEMLKNQEQQEDQKQDKKDEEKKDEQKDKKEEKKEDQQKKQDQQKQDQQKKEEEKQQQQQQPQKISKEEAERILEALKDNEKDLQKELRKVKGKKVKTDKDW